MVEETVWVEKEYVRLRLSSDELWLIYRLIDNQYWLLRRNPHPLWDLEKVAKLHFPHPAHTRFLLIPEVQQSKRISFRQPR
jgi:hypothetical protein